MDIETFRRPADAFAVVPEAGRDPRQVLYQKYMEGQDVLDPLIQAHLMVPREKTIVPEVLRLCARAPKTINNLFRVAVAVGDRGADHAGAVLLGKKFLEIYPRSDKPKVMMEKMVDYWQSHPTDIHSRPFRLSHGDVKAMLEEAETAEDPWISTMWLMHAAANGSQEAYRRLAHQEMERGNRELAVRLLRNVPGARDFVQEELDLLVFTFHDYAKAEELAWTLTDDSLTKWLKVIHYAQGKNSKTAGIEDEVKRLSQ